MFPWTLTAICSRSSRVSTLRAHRSHHPGTKRRPCSYRHPATLRDAHLMATMLSPPGGDRCKHHCPLYLLMARLAGVCTRQMKKNRLPKRPCTTKRVSRQLIRPPQRRSPESEWCSGGLHLMTRRAGPALQTLHGPRVLEDQSNPYRSTKSSETEPFSRNSGSGQQPPGEAIPGGASRTFPVTLSCLRPRSIARQGSVTESPSLDS